MTTLTKAQRKTIEGLAKVAGEITLYRESSSSGKSETLRYIRRWAQMGKWGLQERVESHMILSVEIHSVRGGQWGPNWIDDPRDLEKYNQKCEEAERLFKQLRTVS